MNLEPSDKGGGQPFNVPLDPPIMARFPEGPGTQTIKSLGPGSQKDKSNCDL